MVMCCILRLQALIQHKALCLNCATSHFLNKLTFALTNLLKCYHCKGTIVFKDLKAMLSAMYRQCPPNMYESMMHGITVLWHTTKVQN